MSPLASVLVPCHDKAETLPLTVGTALRQTVDDLEVILIGDGVTDQVRDVISGLLAADDRVRFLDRPKGPHHGEVHRHEAVLAARSEAVFYLCDDDLLLPEHVADLLALLESATFAQSRNGYLRPDGTVHSYAGDLAEPRFLTGLLSDWVEFNFVSITGTAHRREFYLAAGVPWDTTPPGRWPDHHQWRRMAAAPGFRGATSARMTALQFPTSADGRDTWSGAQRYAEVERWYRVATSPQGQAHVDAAVQAALLAQLADSQLAISMLQADRARLTSELADSHARHAAEVDGLRASRSWRLTAPVRRIADLVHRTSSRG